ncbi:hypothetical protein ACRYCC_38510 [Actinomadura scrupuli]|uniref:hypothetical protein n=1 Tax=Actinomadura scrupuli TaxID=559629 RepID=UPI003D973B7A
MIGSEDDGGAAGEGRHASAVTPSAVRSDQSGTQAQSMVTRLLCAGVHLDAAYAESVIKELLKSGRRFVAPSYGFDVLPVLGHALLAGDRQKLKRRVIFLSPLVPVVCLVFGGKGLVIGVFLWLWLTWAAIFLEKLTTRQILTSRLKTSTAGQTRFNGGTPRHRQLTETVSRRIAREQDSRNGVVYYSGYRPFVGAGTSMKSWSFPILLNAASDPMSSNGMTSVAAESSNNRQIKSFTRDEMLSYVEERLELALRTDVPEEERVAGLDLTRRWYRTAIGRHRPRPSEEPGALLRQGEEGYDAAREYLCIRVGAWEQELMNSLFVNFDVRGRTLYCELHAYVLPPIQAAYHEVDRMPERISGRKVAEIAGESFLVMIGEAIGAGITIFFWPLRLFQLWQSRKSLDSVQETEVDEAWDHPSHRTDEIKDFGARQSIRELATSTKFHHFFQSVDATKYAKIVERRLLEIILDFLEEKNVDTGEYRARQAAILNYGIIQTGSGKIVNTGTMAVGQDASAS